MAKKKDTGSMPAINIGISEKDRSAIAGGLAHLLADTYTLYLTTLVVPQRGLPIA